MWSRASGCDSTPIISAVSVTVRVMGPAQRPMKGGSMGMRPRLGLSVAMPHRRRAGAPSRRCRCRCAAGRSRRGGRAGAGAGTTGILAQVPGIAGQFVEAGQAGRQHAVVRHGGLAQHHGACLAHAGRRRRVGAGRCQVGGRGAQRHRHAARGDVLLDGGGHAVQRVAAGRQRLALHPARLGFAGGGQRAFGIQRVGGFQAGFPALDVRQHGAGGFDGDRVLAR